MRSLCLRRSKRFCSAVEDDRCSTNFSLSRDDKRSRKDKSDKLKFVGHSGRLKAMKKLLTQTIVLVIALAIGVSTFAQSPTTATRQRRTSADAAQPPVSDQKTAADAVTPTDQAGDQTRDKNKTPDVATADGQTNRTDQPADEAAIVQNYNNFFTTYQHDPEDLYSVPVFSKYG